MTPVRLAGAGLAALLSACALQTPAPDVRTDAPERLILVTFDDRREPPPARPGTTPRPYDAVTSYRAGSRARATAAVLAADYGLREIAAWPIAPLGEHCVVFEIPATSERAVLLAELAHDPRVRLAQPMQSFRTLATPYNDPYLELQRGFAEIDAAGAQQWSRGEGVRVAVIDTGIDAAHPDLAGRIAATRDFVGADRRDTAADRHGTAVAGIIASVANNEQGIVGVAPAARLLALKACWQGGDGDVAYCNSFTLAQALTVAIEAGARVVNLSLGGPPDPLLTRLVEHALARGTIVVAAVPPGELREGFPVGIPGVIAVDSAGTGASGPALRAPGRNVITLVPGGHYDFVSGSSFAAAHVSGAVALLLAAQDDLSPRDVRALLDRTGAHGDADTGVVNACAALAALRRDGRCRTALPPQKGT